MPEPTWYHLRLSRSHPPGRAGENDSRRKLYAAALQQFEELMHAAGSVSAAARPLPLFYALSQASRAVAAAQGAAWHLSGHGLKLGEIQPDLMHSLVKPDGDRMFQAVSSIVGSAPLIEPVELGALWNSLPDLRGTPLPDAGAWPRALFVWPERQDVSGLSYVMSAEARAAVVFDGEQETLSLDAVTAAMARYRRADGWRLYQPGSLPADAVLVAQTPWGYGVRMCWDALGEHRSEADRQARLQEVAPEYLHPNEQWLRPGFGEAVAEVSPLMTWWALLYGLSMLARYHPAPWLDALAVDASPLAVPLEDAMEVAMEAIPHLVLEAVTNERHLIPR